VKADRKQQVPGNSRQAPALSNPQYGNARLVCRWISREASLRQLLLLLLLLAMLYSDAPWQPLPTLQKLSTAVTITRHNGEVHGQYVPVQTA